MIMTWRVREESLNIEFCTMMVPMWMREGEMEDGDENYMENTSRYEK
jgi:hypothetical protein